MSKTEEEIKAETFLRLAHRVIAKVATPSESNQLTALLSEERSLRGEFQDLKGEVLMEKEDRFFELAQKSQFKALSDKELAEFKALLSEAPRRKSEIAALRRAIDQRLAEPPPGKVAEEQLGAKLLNRLMFECHERGKTQKMKAKKG